MDVFKIEVLKVLLFIVAGLITLRIKAALSISAPSRPLNTVIDGLAFTLVDHALNAFSHYPAVKGAKSLGLMDVGGFPIIVIAMVVGLVIGTG